MFLTWLPAYVPKFKAQLEQFGFQDQSLKYAVFPPNPSAKNTRELLEISDLWCLFAWGFKNANLEWIVFVDS